ncbi:MAG: hypothetical protein R2706_10310 [Acidimicrobiales bacterium]
MAQKVVAEVDRDGVTWRLVFNERLPGNYLKNGTFKPGSTLAKVKTIPPSRTGTRVRFWPDSEIFDSEARIEYQQIHDYVSRVCFLVPGLHIKLHDRRGSGQDPEEFVAAGGLADYVDTLSVGEAVTDILTIHDEASFEEKVPVDGKMTSVSRRCTVDIAARWVKGYDTKIVSFVNTIPTSEGGTHVAGFTSALSYAANDVLLNDAKKLKKLAKSNQDRAHWPMSKRASLLPSR